MGVAEEEEEEEESDESEDDMDDEGLSPPASPPPDDTNCEIHLLYGRILYFPYVLKFICWLYKNMLHFFMKLNFEYGYQVFISR